MRLRQTHTLAVIGATLVASSLGVHASKTYTFQEGVNGYAGTVDTQFRFGSPDRNDANLGVLSIDGSDGGGANHVLLRFENLAGTGAGQIPPGSTVLFATLTLYFVDPGNDPGLHRMLKPWAETNTWNQFDPDALDGVTPDGVEAAVDPDATLDAGNPVPVFTSVDLLPKTIQDWLDGKAPNYGWFFMPSGGGGADFVTSEGSVITQRPLLTVVVGTLGELWLKSVSPGNGATDVPVDANLTFIVRDTTAKLNPSSVQLSVNGQSAQATLDKPAGSDETTITYNPPTDFPPHTRIPVRLIYRNDATPPLTSTNDFSFTTRGTTVTLVAIDDKQVWRYDRTGRDLGTAWKEKNYNDSSWPTGIALIGDEPDPTPEPIRTPIDRNNDLGEYVATFYFRTHFNFTGALGGDLFLRHIIDDGAIFYLNGVEIHRFGYGSGATVAFNNTSAVSHEARYEGPFVLPGSALVTGDNVLAVEVHQSGTSSSDMVFGAELLVATTGLKTTTIDSILPAPNATNVLLSAVIAITLGDGSQQVQTSTIQLSVNGQSVTPTINKPAGSRITAISYDPPGDLPANSKVTVKLVYGDNATPPNVVTNEFSFTTRAGRIYTFQEGVDGYAATQDTFISSGNTAADQASNAEFQIDQSGAGGEYSLLRFENIFGSAPGQIPPKSKIVSATLTVTINNQGNDPSLHRMLVTWDESSNWDSMVDGITADDVEAATTPDATFPGASPRVVIPLPVSTLQAWSDGTKPNYGWVFLPSGTDGVDMDSSEHSNPDNRPLLTVEIAGPAEAPKFTSISRSGANIVLAWTGAGTLQSADAVTGPWTDVANAASPFNATLSGAAKFFRFKP